MGTGIVANAAAVLPVRVAGLHTAATVIWVLAAAVLAGLTGGWIVHWTRRPEHAAGYANDPVMAQFWGAPAMALLTVGAGALLLGKDLIGLSAAVGVDWVLWSAGTGLGLVTACWIPYLMITRHEIALDGAFGGWLMPVVPPMVSAATGAPLIPHLAAGQPRLTMLLGCYAMFGMSLFASVVIITLVWSMWIVLGPLGQCARCAAGCRSRSPGGRLRSRWAPA
jgi:tellurite resistance protein TehA-like permease